MSKIVLVYNMDRKSLYLTAKKLLFDNSEKDKQITELKSQLEEARSQFEYECGCNSQLVDLQEENAKLKVENEKLKSKITYYQHMLSPSEYITSGNHIIRKYILGGETKLLMPGDIQDYLNMYAVDCAQKNLAIAILSSGQNSKAVEKLEEVIEFIKNSDTRPQYWHISQYIDRMIAELKGEPK